MHRTEGQGFAVVSGKQLFQQDQVLGTRVEDREANAVQEEIAQAVERSGQTLQSAATDKGSEDYAASRQLANAIIDLDPTFIPKKISCKWKAVGGTSNGQLGPAFDLIFARHALNKIVTVRPDASQLSIGGFVGCTYFQIVQASDGLLPAADIFPYSPTIFNVIFPVILTHAGVDELARMSIALSAGVPNRTDFRVIRLNAGLFTGASALFNVHEYTYICGL